MLRREEQRGKVRANKARETGYPMENVTNAANGDTPGSIARIIRVKVKGPRAKERAKEKGRTEKDSNRQEDSKQAKAEAHHRG